MTRKIYRKLILDIATGAVLYEDSFEYDGEVVLVKGGGGGSSSSSTPAFVDPSLVPETSAAARSSILDPLSGSQLTDVNLQKATNQIRGGYGARGMAGSGIAARGEQDIISQMILQAQMNNQAALTNLISAESGGASTSISRGGSTGITVICTELHRQGLLSDEVYQSDHKFGLTLSPTTLEGYQLWAVPLVKLMQESKLLTKVVAPFGLAWAKEIHKQVSGQGNGSQFGRVMLSVGLPICYVIGLLLKPLSKLGEENKGAVCHSKQPLFQP